MDNEERLRRFMEDPESLDIALSQLPESEKGDFLDEIGADLLERFKEKGSINDLDYAIEVEEKTLEVTPSDSVDYARTLHNLSIALEWRYQRTGSTKDLDRAIEILNDFGVQRTPVDHPNDADGLHNFGAALNHNLGNSLLSRFDRTGSIEDLDCAIEASKQAVKLTPITDRFKRAMYINNLGLALLRRFESQGSLDDLGGAIDSNTQALELTPVDHDRRAGYCNNLGMALQRRFERTGSMVDLGRAVEIKEQAVQLTPVNHPNYACYTSNLGIALQRRFERMGSMEDLHRAIETSKQAINSTPVDDVDLVIYLNILGISLQCRFERTELKEDLDRVVEIRERTVKLTPLDHPDRTMYLDNLGTSLLSRFNRTGSMEDLDRAIEIIHLVVESNPLGHSLHSSYLGSFGIALRSRFDRTGSIKDLNRIIEITEQAVKLTPADDPTYTGHLTNYATALQRRFERTGSIKDLDHAVATNEKAVNATPLDHPDCATYLNNLGVSLLSRFETTGSMEDLDRAIETKRETLKLMPVDHPRCAGHFNNLAIALQFRFTRTGAIEDLDRAIETSWKAVESSPFDHPKRALCLSNLGTAIWSRFNKVGSIEDLNNAIKISREAVESTPQDHPGRAMYLNNLGNALWSHFNVVGSMEDLDNAIETSREAVDSTPQDHPARARYLSNLGQALLSRYERTSSTEDLDQAIEATEQGSRCQTATPSHRLVSAQTCAALLISHGMFTRAKAILEAAVHLLPRLAPRHLTHTDAQFNISQFLNLTNRAVSLSLEARDDPYKALQLMELGRGIIASLQLEIRSDISVLAADHPELAHRFEELRNQIDSPSTTLERTDRQDRSEPINENSSPLTSNRRTLLNQFDDLMAHIRSLQGFKNFLQGPSKSELLSLCKEGPIVVFNVSDIRSDAFLITPADIRSLCVPSLTLNSVKHFTKANIMGKVKQPEPNPTDLAVTQVDSGETTLDVPEQVNVKRKATLLENKGVSTDTPTMLKWLWDAAVNPVLTELGLTETPENERWPRIWWVTSGLLARLPIHAAGDHKHGSSSNALDRVISSYVPTLQSLAYSREKVKIQFDNDGVNKALLVAMPITPSQSALPFAEKEVKNVGALIPDGITKSIVLHPSKSTLLQHLVGCQVVHFACHGESNSDDPSKSRLLLQDWKEDPLSVADITALNLRKAAFAYLSACSAADVQVESLIDEGIHLAGAFQLAGFPSVVGTLWHISDKHSATVAVDVYQALCEKSGRIHPDDVAGALHLAVRKLRSELEGKSENSLFWAPYIHMGV